MYTNLGSQICLATASLLGLRNRGSAKENGSSYRSHRVEI